MQKEEQLVPNQLLEKSDKILFITHLALGDFTYLQNFFQAFHSKYPHLKIDLWVDEGRGKHFLRRWKSKSNYILYDWLESCSLFNKIYRDTASWWTLRKFFASARQENYYIIVSLASLRINRFVCYARKISPKGFIVGLFAKCKRYQFIKRYNLKKFNKVVEIGTDSTQKISHISEFYSSVFEKLFGISLDSEKRLPFIFFPKKWTYFGKLKFLKWGINKKERVGQKTIFLNAFAKNKKRCWRIENVFELINKLQEDDIFYDARFIVNVLSNDFKKYEESLRNFSSKNIFLFTADFNFFQLPSVISLCDLVISVETSIIHLAAALKIPVVVLMRKKNPEWVPYGTKYFAIFTKKRRGCVKDICVQDVFNALLMNKETLHV